MKCFFSFLFFVTTFLTCVGQSNFGQPQVNPTEIQKSFEIWKAYQTENIMLSRDFVPVSEQDSLLDKSTFFKKMMHGNFIPIRLQSADSIFQYKLFKILPNSDSSIKAEITQMAFDENDNFNLEGKKFPEFNFTDLNGNEVSNATTKGKIMVVKCWFIHCAKCVKEIPVLNKLVEEYKDRNDIIFVSFAEDNPEQLKAFLAKKPLSYSVIPNLKQYMNEVLELNAFPTHFIVNKEGIIAKVLPNDEALKVALENESKK
jgi:peroxiredoxin